MKRRINVTVDKNVYTLRSTTGAPLSGQANAVPDRQARCSKAEEWKQENREGMDEVAQLIAQNGSFADENRNW
ncbi:type II toxin-antitoxin system CcdA family antitoxin [Dickeya oryzae]|uniref:type II toxin-antitoxin system CcdA family antitoxin n=1 Tax=Dickeya oryzae TaxID=1240404 RepID=UPI00039A469B|nr:type II toxin-antitoxin system CcdA family antitoxin [Dickeya oryzae]MBP2848137.1 type II toxin-antitoxin system CcdA family antitoxin [Dickeya oryzae]